MLENDICTRLKFPLLLQLKVIAFTHKTIPIKEFNRFFLHDENHDERLSALKFSAGLDGIMYLSTCNRIEFIFNTSQALVRQFLKKFFQAFRSDWSEEELNFAIDHAQTFEGENALNHLYRVASSMDSLVVGEREIITQVRNAYEKCNNAGLTDDLIRLVIKSVITTAKKVYTDTKIAEQPVSVVSIAIRNLMNGKQHLQSNFILIGAGETMQNIARYLSKYSHGHFTIYNRTLNNANTLAGLLKNSGNNVVVKSLYDLPHHKSGADVIITCTGSPEAILTEDIFTTIQDGDKSCSIIDLAVPADTDSKVIHRKNVHYTGIEELKAEAEKNLLERESELLFAEKIIAACLVDFRQLFKTRKVELRMKEVPEKIREIKTKAVTSVFAKEIETLDEHGKEVLAKVLDYMEKKCVSIPMVMAKEIILDNND